MMGPDRNQLASGEIRSNKSEKVQSPMGRLRPDKTDTQVLIESVPEEHASVESWESSADIIRRDVRWEVQHDIRKND